MDIRRRLPSVDQLLNREELGPVIARHGRPVVLRHARELLEELRARAGALDEPQAESELAGLPEALARRVAAGSAPSLVPVLNATGVVVHTNLGRAPLSPEAARRVALIAAGYSNLEYDLERGERGHREVHAETRLRALLGAEGVVVVNNNAAAVMLTVNTFAEGREVLVSRGELVEIGGSFRIPEVLRKGGARLREVGTTNRTRVADYAAAIGPETGLILKVHPSNFRIVGFTEEPELGELAELARRSGLPLAEDLGSGLLSKLAALPEEPIVADRLAAGLDVVTWSGDKLLGGPQAGFAAGARGLVDRMRKNPLYRALRVDKLTLAALDATLADHEAGRAAERVPVLRMLALTEADVRRRAEPLASALAAAVPALHASVIPGESAVGGGAAPTVAVPSALVALRHEAHAPGALAAALRRGEPPVVARVADDRLLLDLRTIAPEDEPVLCNAVVRAVRALDAEGAR